MRFAIYRRDDQTRGGARYFEVSTTADTFVGSAEGCQVVVDDPDVAPRHLRMRALRGSATAFELEPLAPTLVDGDPLAAERWVKPRSRIELGSMVIEQASGSLVRIRPHWGERRQGTFNPPSPPNPAPAAPPPIHHEVLAHDAIEHDLLAAIRSRPDDEHTRGVYADWLEQQGHAMRAKFVRDEDLDAKRLVRESTPAWRAITSRAVVVMCWSDACPRRWHLLRPTDDERVRSCGQCSKAVRFLPRHGESENALIECVWRRETYVLDADWHEHK